jgi:hypothetical protein
MGPSASILLRNSLTEEQLIDLEQWLPSITSPLEGRRGHWGPFWIKDGPLIGLPDDCREACAFSLAIDEMETEQGSLEEDDLTDEDIQAELRAEREQFVLHIGFVPEQRINVDANCSQPSDHRLLGQIVLLLSERYDGIIDLCGAFYSPSKPGQVNRSLEDKTVEGVEQYVKELSLPGRIFHMYYLIGENTTWIYHLVDPDFLRAWLQHPDFHMIK